MFTYIWGWLTGYIIIHINGINQERFINLAMQQNIELANMRWLTESLLEVQISQKDIGQLKKIAKVTNCTLKIRMTKGLPFAYKYAKQRKAFLAGLLLFMAGIFCLSQLVFDVTVTPREDVGDLDLMEVERIAEELGLRTGTVYKTLNIDELSASIRKEIPELSWVYIERNGTKVNIEVAVRSQYSQTEDDRTKGAIYASHTALIEEVLVKRGYANVAVGDTVSKGDLLILEDENGRADAIVKARVWYEGYGEGSLSEEIITAAGDEQRIYWLENENGKKLILWALPHDEISDATFAQSRISANLIYGEYDLVFHQEILQPQFVTSKKISEDSAKKMAYEQAIASLQKQVGVESELLTEDVTYDLLDGLWSATIRWECKEEIGVHADEL